MPEASRRAITSRLATVGMLFMLAGPAIARAATQTATAFHFNGHSLRVAPLPVAAGWNPTAASPLNLPGTHIVFFGHASPCQGTGQNGQAGPLSASQVSALARRDHEFPPTQIVWSPLPGAPACAGAGGAPGPSFVSLGGGVLRLYTRAGTANHGFAFGAFTEAGQNGLGANASIVGTFVNFVFNWHAASALAPFAGPRHTLAVRTDQSVSLASAAAATRGVNQVKQQVAISFINRACEAAHGRFCEVRLMLDIDVVRAPGTQWSSLAGFSHANLMFDPAQNGLPVIEGPLLTAGTETMLPGSGPIWRSAGAPTAHGPFPARQFAAELPFSGFLNCLRAVTARAGIALSPAAQSPGAWRVNLVNIAQEDHTVSQAVIGGTITRLSLVAR